MKIWTRLLLVSATASEPSAKSANPQTRLNFRTDVPGPPIPGETENLDNLWNKYCVGTQTDAASIPGPNYATPEVKSASEMLTRFRDYSYSIYGQIAAHYKATPVAKPEGVSDNAHTFLTYLCGEFRDRPTMVEAKIRWINHTNFLKPEAQGQIDPTGTQTTPAERRRLGRGEGAVVDIAEPRHPLDEPVDLRRIRLVPVK